jgi:cytochrome c biogenesis factor
VQNNANEGWQKMGESISSMGASVTAVGVACSALGGIMASMGMEEAGEVFSTVGNILVILGGAISTIGTLVPIVTKILVASGYSVQGAWWPLLVIGLALAALVGTVMLIVSAIKEAEAQKLENRMKAAAEATEEAKSQAQDAKKAYEDLLSDRSAYNELQQTLEDLTYGTKEWKEALIEANE